VLDTVIDPDNNKRLQQLYFQAEAAQLDCAMVVVVSEAWSVVDDGRTFQGVPVSQRPDRLEVVGVYVLTPGESYVIFQVFTRDYEKRKISFGETHEFMGTIPSALTDLLWSQS